MSDPIDLAKPHRPIRVGVILMNSETEILDVAPIDLLNGMSKEFVAKMPLPDEMKSKAIDIDFHWVNESGKTARLTGGIHLEPTDSFSTCPPLDITLIGAHTMGYNPTETELEFVRKSYNDAAAFLTVCGGFHVGLQAGLFKGKTCTAPRGMLATLREQCPETTWVEKRYVQDGKIWTSGALLNGLELMRAFATQTWGNEGPGGLLQFMIGIGHFPDRDIDYKDSLGPL